MGWDGCYNWRTKADVIADTERSMVESKWIILGKKSTTQGVYWAVKHPSGEEFIYCGLIERHGGCLMIKTMCESSGPYMDDCPMKLLALVKGDGSEGSKMFRQGCVDFQNKKQLKKVMKLLDSKVGQDGKV